MKTLLLGIFLRLKITMNQVKSKKLGFRIFCRIVTPALTLRSEIHISAFFEYYLGFAIFMSLLVGF